MRPARRADNFAVLVVPNVKLKMEAQRSTHPLYDLLRESFTFTSTTLLFVYGGNTDNW